MIRDDIFDTVTIYFISDLHLTPARPRTTELFHAFLESTTDGTEALYILGDLFEFWIGDDAVEVIGQAGIFSALRRITARGIPVYFMHGNRDFLVGGDFASETGCRLLADPSVITLDGRKILLMHGDSMCTDDAPHQEFRALVLDPDWQRDFLRSPVAERLALANDARSQSALHKSMTSMEIMDVNLEAVEGELARFGADILIHGHTHRPGIHSVGVDGRAATRIVLGDWYQQDSVLRYENGSLHLRANNTRYPPVRLR